MPKLHLAEDRSAEALDRTLGWNKFLQTGASIGGPIAVIIWRGRSSRRQPGARRRAFARPRETDTSLPIRLLTFGDARPTDEYRHPSHRYDRPSEVLP